MVVKEVEKLIPSTPIPTVANILLVDDREDGLLALEAVLSSPEYNLIKARSGQEALSLIYDNHFAVILLDVQMPVMDGFETARLIRQYEPSMETPIIFITAINKDSHHISRGYESGAIDYLFKPLDPSVLKSKVKIFVELYQIRENLKKANEELETRVSQRTSELIQTNKELEQFAYIASHDLQEPLRKIIIFGEKLKEHMGASLNQTGHDYLDRMRRSSLRMKTVIEDLLVFSKINTQEVGFEEIDLKEIIQEILTDLDMKISDHRARIEIKELPVILANRSQIHHLFQNLILNSIKFAKKNEPPHVVIDSAANGHFVDIRVKDNGIGFDEKYLGHIFKLFHRLHSQHEYEGNGIGLSICQKIAQQYGGQITAHSQPGEGATFIVSLPYHPALNNF
ncbi:MAG: response regulator [Candidatus Omnitrophica bacterium]|nr:response regulator [Candidatus Omnitrophota bacterium]